MYWWRGWAIVGAVVFLLALERLTYVLPDVDVALNGRLSPVQVKAIDLLVEVTQMFIGFAYAIVGALALIAHNKTMREFAATRFEIALLAGTLTLAILSLFFGQSVLSAVFEMLANDFVALTDPGLLGSARWQYLSLVGATVGLIAWAVGRTTLGGEESPRRPE